MDKRRSREIMGLLGDALELSHSEHPDFLARLGADDPALGREVAALLRAGGEAPAFLDGNAVKFARQLLPEDPAADSLDFPDYRDQLIGPYRLIAEIAKGGMGVVYRAERAEGSFDQQVAIKLLPFWHNRGELLNRFRQEQQVLASLIHPNIAQLYDGGVTDGGQPYIVMEYVAGKPVNRYCDEHRLSVDARLDIVSQIVRALSYAHRKLIVHRDIKPSNILVTGDGQAKLLDFGIAKLLDDDVVAMNLTQTGERIMTPGLAAPEQIRGQAVTVATDVYQLGVVIYELLTGRRPFQNQDDSLYDMARVICEQMPVRPSAAGDCPIDDTRRAATGGEGTGQCDKRRGPSIVQLRKRLSGDLDAIVLKTLRKEPEARYTSMEALEADLRAYGQGHPVAARRQSFSYQASKFVLRHRWGVAAGSAIVALMIGYAITVTVQANRIQSALARVQVEAHKAEQVSGFLFDLFKVSDPNVSGIETVTARELLEKGRQRVRDELADVPETQAQMLYLLGEIYYSLGSYEESASLLEAALSTRRTLLSGHDPVLADTLIRLGVAYQAVDRYREARALFEEALSIYEPRGIETAEKGEALNAMGSVLRKQGDYPQARVYFEQAVTLLRRVTDGKHYELPVALNNLAALQVQQGELAAAERNMREAVVLQERILGPEHSYFSVSLNNLAAILTQMEFYEEAEPLHRRALRIQDTTLGTEHPYVAYTLWTLGTLMHKKHNLEEAEGYLSRALLIHESNHGRQSVPVASSLSRLGAVLQDQGRYAEADSSLTEALRTDLAVLPAGNRKLGRDYNRLASLARVTGDLALARTRYEKALEILPASSPETASAKLGYARLLLDLGELNEAAQSARAALETRRSKLPAGHSMTAEARSVLGAILLRIGDTDAASALLRPAHQVLQERRPRHDPALLETEVALSLLGPAYAGGAETK